MANKEGFFRLDPWPGPPKPRPRDRQAYSLYYRQEVPITLAPPPWETPKKEPELAPRMEPKKAPKRTGSKYE